MRYLNSLAFIGPDALLHDPELAHPQLLVDRNIGRRNDVLAGHPGRPHHREPLVRAAVGRRGRVAARGALLPPGAQQPLELGQVVVGEVLLVVPAQAAHLRLGHAQLGQVAVGGELQLGGVGHFQVVSTT